MTAADYITAAVARSYRNLGDVGADPTTELLGVLTRLFAGYYADAFDQNPAVLVKQAIVAWNVLGYWTKPTDQHALYELRTATNLEVVVVPFSDKQAEVSEAAVYRLGNNYYPAGNANDPSNVALTFTYQPIPPAFTLTTDTPPPEWPAQFDQRVVTDLAWYLASKDGRPEDVAVLEQEAQEWARLWGRWLAAADVNTVRRFSVPQQVATPSVVPVGVRGGGG